MPNINQLKLLGFLTAFLILIYSNAIHARWGEGSDLTKEITIKNNGAEAKLYIHGYPRDKEFMARVEQVLLTDALKLFDYFKHFPQDPVHLIIESEVRQANGMATTFPKNKIILYTMPPEAESNLLASDDWVRTLVLHELTHVIQGDMTSGFPGLMRNIFGGLFKWNLFTPRWFSEGSAVWAETAFTAGGRNRYVMNNLQLDRYLLQPGSCDNISCLDDAPTPPYQGLSYYLGGKFMEYLENKRPGTVRCLMKDNSANVPFFLYLSFRGCLNQEIEDSFLEFIASYRLDLIKKQKNFAYLPWSKQAERLTILENLPLVYDPGMALHGNQLLYASSTRGIEELLAFDLQKRTARTVPLQDKLHALNSQHPDRVVVGEYDYDGEDVLRKWEVLDKNLLPLSTLEEDYPSSYIFWTGEYYLSLRYQQNRWSVYTPQGKLLSLERFRTLSHPSVVNLEGNSFLIFKSYHRGEFSLEAIDLKSLTRKNLYRDQSPFNLVGQYQGAVLINRPSDQSDKLLVLHLRQQSYTVKMEKAHQLARVYFSKDHVVYLHPLDPTGVYLYQGTPEQFFAWLRGESSNYEKEKFLSVDHQDEALKDQSGFESYPKMSFFKPDYWFFGGLYSGNQKEMTLLTSISDPMQNHQLYLSVTHYAEPRDVGGQVNYAYQLREYLFLGLDYERELLWSETRERSYRQDQTKASITYLAMNGRWYLPLSLSYQLEREDNIVTEHKEHLRVADATATISHLPRFFDSFINKFSLLGSFKRRNGEIEEYNALSAAGMMRFYFNSSFSAYLSGEWERRYKDSLGDGVSEYAERFGSISGGDLFGNRLSHADLHVKWLSHEIYQGWGNKPIFWRTLSPTLGIEAIKAPYAYVDDQLKRDVTLTHAYLGLDFALRLGYLFDLSIIPSYGVLLNNGEGSFLIKVGGQF